MRIVKFKDITTPTEFSCSALHVFETRKRKGIGHRAWNVSNYTNCLQTNTVTNMLSIETISTNSSDNYIFSRISIKLTLLNSRQSSDANFRHWVCTSTPAFIKMTTCLSVPKSNQRLSDIQGIHENHLCNAKKTNKQTLFTEQTVPLTDTTVLQLNYQILVPFLNYRLLLQPITGRQN